MNQKIAYESWNSDNSVMRDADGQWQPVPDLMTEEELIRYLRIPEVSKAQKYRYVIENLKRMHDLPCMHLCRQPLYPRKSIEEWILLRCR
jgi:hypothetical protein